MFVPRLSRLIDTAGVAVAVAYGLPMLFGPALAADRPPAPVSVSATAPSQTQVVLRFLQPGIGSKEWVTFEIEQTTNGVRIAHREEAQLASMVGASVPSTYYYKTPLGIVSWWPRDAGVWAEFDVRGLAPQADYCFRAWTRAMDGMRSDAPSAWACARTPPYPPLAPLDAKAQLRSIGDHVPMVSWSAPDMSGWRGIDGYAIERQSPPGPNRPWIPEKTVSGGPNGSPQSPATGLAHAIATTAIDPQQAHVYRICAVNEGGRTCAAPVALEKLTPSPQQAQQSSTAAAVAAARTPSVAGPLGAPSTRSTTLQVPQATAAPAPVPSGTSTVTGGAGSSPSAGMVSAAQKLQAAQGQQGSRDGTVSTSDQSGGSGSAIARSATQPSPSAALRITAPMAGGEQRQGELRVQIASQAVVARDVEVEFTNLAPKPGERKAAAPTRLQWTVAQDQLARGAVVPAGSGPRTSGRWQMRVRPVGASVWSEPVAFDFVAASDSKGKAWGRKADALEQRGLNPQPLPPKEAARTNPFERQALNPQPLPPREATTPAERRTLNPQSLPARDLPAPATTFQR